MSASLLALFNILFYMNQEKQTKKPVDMAEVKSIITKVLNGEPEAVSGPVSSAVQVPVQGSSSGVMPGPISVPTSGSIPGSITGSIPGLAGALKSGLIPGQPADGKQVAAAVPAPAPAADGQQVTPNGQPVAAAVPAPVPADGQPPVANSDINPNHFTELKETIPNTNPVNNSAVNALIDQHSQKGGAGPISDISSATDLEQIKKIILKKIPIEDKFELLLCLLE